MGQRMGVARATQSVGRGTGGGRDAERGRRRRGHPWRAAGGCAGQRLHRLPGAAADDPEHVQDRGRADPDGAARRGALDRGPGPVHLRRPHARDVRAHDRLCHAVLGQRAGGAGLRPGRTDGHPALARALPAFLRRFPHLARDQQNRGHPGRHHPRTDRRETDHRAGNAHSARTTRCCAAARRTRTCTSRAAKRSTPITRPPRISWNSAYRHSARPPDAATACSSITGTRSRSGW